MGKQYLVVKVAQGLGAVVDMTPFAGLFTREAAQKFLEEIELAEPGSTFLIQEVGVA